MIYNPFCRSISKTVRALLVSSLSMGGLVLPFATSVQAGIIINPSPIIVDFTGTVTELIGTGNGVPNGALVSGAISFNEFDFAISTGNGSTSVTSEYEDPQGSVNISINGNVTTFQGLELTVVNNGMDVDGNPADGFSFGWGPGTHDNVFIYYPTATEADSSLASAWSMDAMGLTGSLPVNGDAAFDVNFDSSGADGAYGPLATYNATAVPEPSALALGILGGGFLLRTFIRRKEQTAPSNTDPTN
jgi:hypothetical protein